MSGRRGRVEAGETDAHDGFPAPPEGWQPAECRDASGPWVRGVAEVDADDADRSGADKGLRRWRGLAWAVRLMGGSVHRDRQRLEAARLHKSQAIERADRMKATAAPAHRIDEAEGEAAAADREIEALTALVAAEEAWPGRDNVTIRREAETARARIESIGHQLEPYRHARLRPPVEIERGLFDAEHRVADTEAAWSDARRRFVHLNGQLKDAAGKARLALAGSLGTVCKRLGQKAKQVIADAGDPGYLVSFPHRAPDEIVALHARAVRVSGIMHQLGSGPDRGVAAFLAELDALEKEIVICKVEGGTAPVRDFKQPSRPHPDAAMNAIY